MQISERKPGNSNQEGVNNGKLSESGFSGFKDLQDWKDDSFSSF